MLTRLTRWFLITAPIVAGTALLIFGTAGGISIAFGIVLIGISPIVWMWNWFIRMSFDEEREKAERARERRAAEPPTKPPPERPVQPERHRQPPVTHHRPRELTRPPRRRR